MSEYGLTKRQLRREREILAQAEAQGARNRTVPISLFRKLLDSADFAVENSYWSEHLQKQIRDARFSDEMAQVAAESEPIQ